MVPPCGLLISPTVVHHVVAVFRQRDFAYAWVDSSLVCLDNPAEYVQSGNNNGI